MAQHLAEEHEVEQVKNLWLLSDDDVASVVTALKLKPVSANYLKEAVKAAQVSLSFSYWVPSCLKSALSLSLSFFLVS